MDTLVDNPIILNVTSTYGCVLIGLLFSFGLYGIGCMQVFLYSMHAEKDPFGMRIFIAVLWVLETVNQGCLVWGSWDVFVSHYGSLKALGGLQTGVMHHIWIGHIVIFSTQMYLARRIWLFGMSSTTQAKKVYVSLYLLIVVMLTLGEIVCVIVYMIKGYNGADLAALSVQVEIRLNMSIRICAATVDILIAFGMVYLLKETAPKFTKLQRMVHRMIIVSVSTGSLTALFATLVMILLAVRPYELWFCIFDFPLCSLYFNTLLANVNSRSYIRGADDDYESGGNMFTMRNDIVSTSTTLAMSPAQLKEKNLSFGRHNRSVINISRVESGDKDTSRVSESQVIKVDVQNETVVRGDFTSVHEST